MTIEIRINKEEQPEMLELLKAFLRVPQGERSEAAAAMSKYLKEWGCQKRDKNNS